MRTLFPFCLLLALLVSACVGSAVDDQQTAPKVEPDIESSAISIDSPVALDNLIGHAESLVLKVSGTADADDGQSVTLILSDGNGQVSASATVNEGKWVTDKTDLTSLNNGPLKITASVTDRTGNIAKTEFSQASMDKGIMPPAPSREGTIWIVDKVITAEDPSTLQSLTPAGTGERTMFDRRENGWVRLEPMLFMAKYANGHEIEVQVNPEFSSEDALVEAQRYAEEIGRLPRVLRRDAKTVWIHKGRNPFGGGNNNYLIHTGMSDEVYIPRSNLEETLVHEGSHTSLDSHIKDDPDWLYAQEADGTFISNYARDNPNREDIGETFLLYLAYRYRPESLREEQKRFIEAAMSYRMVYFDKQQLDLSPFDR